MAGQECRTASAGPSPPAGRVLELADPVVRAAQGRTERREHLLAGRRRATVTGSQPWLRRYASTSASLVRPSTVGPAIL